MFHYYREIRKELSNRKNVSITVTTGMARLQFQNAMTIHHWSRYGDGHIPVDTLIEHIMTPTAYEYCSVMFSSLMKLDY